MTQKSAFAEAAAKAIEAHNQISKTVQEVQKAMRQVDPTTPDPASFSRLTNQILELQSQLSAHFCAEETVGLLKRLEEILPHATGEIERLQVEHTTMLDGLTQSQKSAKQCTPVNAERLLQQMSDLLSLLETHEKSENELMAKAFGISEHEFREVTKARYPARHQSLPY